MVTEHFWLYIEVGEAKPYVIPFWYTHSPYTQSGMRNQFPFMKMQPKPPQNLYLYGEYSLGEDCVFSAYWWFW